MKYYVPAWMDESIGMSRPIEKYEYGLFIAPEEAWMFCLKDANAGETERTITVSETDDIMYSMIFVTYNDGTVGVHFVKEATLRNYFRDQTFVCEYIDSFHMHPPFICLHYITFRSFWKVTKSPKMPEITFLFRKYCFSTANHV